MDTVTRQLIGTSDHLTVFDIDTNDWAAATLPTVKGFQVSSFSGAATYAYPIQVPPGPGGLQPQIGLTYNSQAVDGATNRTQAAWVGMGWSLDTGYIERDMHATSTLNDDTFVLVLNGTRYRLLPGSDGKWHTEDESFLRIEYGNGTTHNPNTPAHQNRAWTVWDQVGNQYSFGSTDEGHRATYPKGGNLLNWHWSLREQKNSFGQALTYSYAYEGLARNCGADQFSAAQNDLAVYPSEILYPNGKYRIRFALIGRYDFENGWNDPCATIRFSKSLLSEIIVEHKNGTVWELVRKYVLTYGDNGVIIFPAWYWNAGGPTPTLTTIREYGADGTSSLPATTFSYGDNMHLTKAQNGYGGSVEFDYSRWHELTTDDVDDLDQQNECGNYSWDSNVADTIRQCATNAPSGLRFKKTGSATYGTVWENNLFQVFRPGSVYRFYSHFKRWGSTTPPEVRTGIDYGGAGYEWANNGAYELIDEAGVPEPGDPVDAYVLLPTTANRLRLTYQGNGVLRDFTPYMVMTRYRVSQKRVKDSHTNKTHTFTYQYDGAATNDAAHSAIVAVPTTTAQRYFTEPYSEFRGHAMVKEKGPDGRITLNWYRQDDIRSGQLVRQQVGEELFADDFEANGVCVPAASFSSGSWNPAGAVSMVRNTGDCSLKLANTAADWSTNIYRSSNTLQDGELALLQFKLVSGGGEATLALESNNGRRWGIYVKTDNSVVVQWNNGSGFPEAPLLAAGSFKRDTWYVLMVGSESGADLVRLWERDSSPENVAVQRYQTDQVASGDDWRFRAWVNNGTLQLDTYLELKLLSETETKIDASAIALQSGWTLTTLSGNQSFTLIGLNGYWTRPAYEKTLLFNNDTKWVGKQVDYFYETPEQSGAQYGNLTRTVEREWNGSTFVAYRSTKRWFYPTNTSTTYLVGLPGAENRFACPAGNCDYGADDILTSQWYLYDGQSSYNVAPTTGKLTGGRTWICPANNSNVCVAYGAQTKLLYSDIDYAYDGFGNRTSQTVYTNYGTETTRASTIARTTTYGYDSGGYNTYRVSETNPANHVTTWGYDYRKSVPTQETDPNNVTTTAQYDTFGRLTKVIRPGDSSSSPTVAITYYDSGVNNSGPFGTRLEQNHIGGVATIYKFYDGLGQLIQQVSYNATVNGNSRDIIVNTEYDAYGRAIKQRAAYDTAKWAGSGTPFRAQSFPSGETTVTTYDPYGRITKVASPTANEDVDYFYTTDLTTVMRNARGYDTTTVYDIWGRVKEVRPASDPWLRYSYDGADRLLQVEKMTGASSVFGTTTMSYDNAGRKLSMNDMDMGAWSYRYDALGNLTSQVDARGCTTTLTYNDGLSRLTGKSYSGLCGVTTAAVTYGYDATTPTGNLGKGKRTSMSDGSGSTTWFYGDNRGRLTKESKTITDSGNFITKWSYDSADQIAAITYPDGEVVTYGYLPQMTLNTVMGNSVYVNSTWVDAAGRVELRELGAGVDKIRTDYNYNAWNTQGGRLQSIKSGTPNGNTVNATLQDLTYSYDLNGNAATIVDALAGGTQTQSFGYDGLDRLTTATASGGTGGTYATQSYSYDSYGRLLNGPLGNNYAYGDSSHKHGVTNVANSSRYTFSYDANGNMNYRFAMYLNYDAENRLTSPGNGSSFVYDGDNHRVKATTSGVPTVYIGNYYEVESDKVWVDDALPTGALTAGDTDNWSWIGSNPAPVVGTLAHTSALANGLHQHYFYNATQTLALSPDDTLYAYVYLDPTNPPQEVMLQWYENSSGWEHRAYWGSDLIGFGTNNTNSRRFMGTLPATGGWVRLEVPTGLVGLGGVTINGMAFTLYGGKATWDRAGAARIKKYYYAGAQRVAMQLGLSLYRLLHDHLGSTAVTVSGITEASEARYYAWGKDRFTSGSTLTSFKYTGQRYEDVLSFGLYDYGARWYDPQLGRFIQPDTLVPNPGDAQAFDRYAYVSNNPLKYTDPTGHYSPEELMEHFGCDNIQCVTDHFGPDGDYAGQWGWFTVLTQAQDGDQIYAHSIGAGLDGNQLDSELMGTFARVNGKIMIRLAGTAQSNAATGARQATRFASDTLVPEKTGAVYGNLGSFGWYQLTGQSNTHAYSQDKSVNCSYDDCVSLAIDGAADAASAVAVGCAMAGQVGCLFVAGAAGKGLAVGSVAYTGYHTFVTGNSTGTDFTVTLTTSIVSFFAPPGAGLVAGEVQTLYDYNALKRKPE